jgi:hypothetical protein
MIQLVCIDVDGTLVGSSGTITANVWAALARAHARGLHLCLCSGRPGFGLTREFAERVSPRGWHAFQNGASVLNLGTGETLSSPLSAGLVADLIERARAADRILEIYSDTAFASESGSPVAAAHARFLGVPFAPTSFAALPRPVVRAQWLVPLDEAAAVMAEPHPGLEVAYSTAPVMPDTAFINLTGAGVSKASALQAIAGRLGVALSDVMMVGDGDNDLAALRVAGFPVAMGNGRPEVKAAARLVVGDVDDDGLVEALDAALAP